MLHNCQLWNLFIGVSSFQEVTDIFKVSVFPRKWAFLNFQSLYFLTSWLARSVGQSFPPLRRGRSKKYLDTTLKTSQSMSRGGGGRRRKDSFFPDHKWTREWCTCQDFFHPYFKKYLGQSCQDVLEKEIGSGVSVFHSKFDAWCTFRVAIDKI